MPGTGYFQPSTVNICPPDVATVVGHNRWIMGAIRPWPNGRQALCSSRGCGFEHRVGEVIEQLGFNVDVSNIVTDLLSIAGSLHRHCVLELKPLEHWVIQFKFSVTWSCVSLPRHTTSSDWKFMLFVKFRSQMAIYISVFQDWKHILLWTAGYQGLYKC